MSEAPERPFSPTETAELVQRVKEGDEIAMEQLLQRVMPRIQRWARGRLPRGSRGMLDTVDIVQDVVVSSVRHLDGFEHRGPGSFIAYLRRGLVNRLEDERRKIIRRPLQTDMPMDIKSPGPSPLDSIIGKENRARYEAALRELSEADQAAIIGRFEWEYSYADLAVALGKPTEGAARAAVVRAVQRLLAIIGGTAPQQG